MPNLLALETSSSLLSVALKKGKEKISERTVSGLLHHAENLMPLLDELLKKKKLKVQDIDTFLIGRGPGSFTGLRIGFAALKGLLSLQKREVWGALSLDLIAEGIDLPRGSQLCVCLDARREKIYARLYSKAQNWIAEEEPKVLSLEEFAGLLPPSAFLAGDAIARFGAALQKIAGEKEIHFLPEKSWTPRASTLIALYKKYGGAVSAPLRKLCEPADFLPLYFRLSEAEEKRGTYAGTH